MYRRFYIVIDGYANLMCKFKTLIWNYAFTAVFVTKNIKILKMNEI